MIVLSFLNQRIGDRVIIVMNIFYIHDNPIVAATQLCDQHVCKMQIESAQMLCTTHWETNSQAPYKSVFKNHPCNVWLIKSIHHYRWLTKHGLQICVQFERRYRKVHATKQILIWCYENEPIIPNTPFTEPPQCMPEEFKMSDTVSAYRNFYIKDKIAIKKLNWNKLNNPPKWANL